MSGVVALHRLLVQASSLPCSRGATAFLSLVPAENDLLPPALDALLPALQHRNLEIPQRILAAYILDALFPSQRHLNPFHDHLLRVFESEQAVAVADSRFFEPSPGSPPAGGGSSRSENDQFVWVLWKILKGEGGDLAPYSPNILSSTVLPEHLRAPRLVLQDSSPDVHLNAAYSPIMELSHSMPQLKTTATFQNAFDAPSPLTASIPPLTYAPTEAHVSSTASFSPFNNLFLDPRSTQHQSALGLTDDDTDGWLQELVPSDVHEEQYQVSHERSRIAFAHLSSHQVPSSTPIDLRFTSVDDQRRQALLRALCEEPHLQARGEIAGQLYPQVGMVETEDRYGVGVGSRIQYRPSQVLQTQQPQLTPFRQPHAPPQLCTSQFNVQFHPNRQDSAPTSSSLFVASVSTNVTKLPPLPIARPHLVPSLYHRSAPYTAPPVPDVRFPSKLPPQQQIDHFSQQTRANGLSQESRALQVIGLQPQAWKSNDVSQPSRTPGVIGSGRPSSFMSKGLGPGHVDDTVALERRPPVGVIGNGRPASSVIVKDTCTVLTAKDAGEVGRDGMMPYSVLGVEESPVGGGRRDFGAIGRPESEVRHGSEKHVGGPANGFWGATLVQALPEMVDTTAPKPQLRVTDSTSLTDHAVSKEPVEPVFTSHATLELKALSLETRPFPVSVRSPEDCIEDNGVDPVSSSQRHSTASPSTSPIIEGFQLKQQSETSHLPPVRVSLQKVTSAFNIDETELDMLSHAIVLLLGARERVLTLPEQRLLSPHLPMLTRPFSFLRPSDLPRVVANNPDIAVKLLVLLLDKDDEGDAQIERVLRDVSKNNLFSLKHGPASDTLFPCGVSIDSLAALNVIQATMEFMSSCGGLSISTSDSACEMEKILSYSGKDAKEGCLNVLRKLPPTMQSFNLIARLLRPTHAVTATDGTREQEDTREVRIANLVKTEVLGGFVSGCVQWIEQAEQEKRAGVILDDRVAVAVSGLSRFYSSLLKHGFVSAVSEVDTTEIMSFALQFSRFEEASSLYSTLAAARA